MMTPGLERLRNQLVAALCQHLGNRQERPRVPEAGILLWNAFLELDATRTYGTNGPAPISYVEIETWARLNGYHLGRHHVAILRAMDSALIGRFAQEVKRQQAQNRSGAKAKSAMTPAIFDSRFGG